MFLFSVGFLKITLFRYTDRCVIFFFWQGISVDNTCLFCCNMYQIQRVSRIMTRFQIIISNNESVLHLQSKLQTIK